MQQEQNTDTADCDMETDDTDETGNPSGSGESAPALVGASDYLPVSHTGPSCSSRVAFLTPSAADYPAGDFGMVDASLITAAKAKQPSMFVSGWEETDTQGVEVDPVFESSPAGRLLHAAEIGDLAGVTEILSSSSPELVHARDSDGYTALHRAAQENHVEIIKVLLSNGADPQARTLDGWEPLHCACRWGCTETVWFLVGQVLVDVNTTTNGKITPLHLAACCKGPDGAGLAHILLNHHRIDLSIRNGSGELAAQIGRRTSAEMALLFEEAERLLGLLPPIAASAAAANSTHSGDDPAD